MIGLCFVLVQCARTHFVGSQGLKLGNRNLTLWAFFCTTIHDGENEKRTTAVTNTSALKFSSSSALTLSVWARVPVWLEPIHLYICLHSHGINTSWLLTGLSVWFDLFLRGTKCSLDCSEQLTARHPFKLLVFQYCAVMSRLWSRILLPAVLKKKKSVRKHFWHGHHVWFINCPDLNGGCSLFLKVQQNHVDFTDLLVFGQWFSAKIKSGVFVHLLTHECQLHLLPNLDIFRNGRKWIIWTITWDILWSSCKLFFFYKIQFFFFCFLMFFNMRKNFAFKDARNKM